MQVETVLKHITLILCKFEQSLAIQLHNTLSGPFISFTFFDIYEIIKSSSYLGTTTNLISN
jgi:hypothetical protein